MPIDLQPMRRSATEQEADGMRLTGRHVLLIMVAFFGVIIAVNMTMMWLAIRTMPGLDVKSAYEASQNFNRELGAIAAQDARGWQVDIVVPPNHPGAEVSVFARDRVGAPVDGLSVTARFERPTDKRMDLVLPLVAAGPGAYTTPMPGLAPGQWDLIVEMTRMHERVYQSRRRIAVKE